MRSLEKKKKKRKRFTNAGKYYIKMSLTKLLYFITDYVTNKKDRGGKKRERKTPKKKQKNVRGCEEIFVLRCCSLLRRYNYSLHRVIKKKLKRDLWGVSALFIHQLPVEAAYAGNFLYRIRQVEAPSCMCCHLVEDMIVE